MATWPDRTDAEAYIGAVNDTDLPVLDECLAAAVECLTYRCTTLETETVGEDDEQTEVPVVPPTLYEACLLLTSRLFRRRLSPEGVAGFGDFGAVRVSYTDPDVERLIVGSGKRSWGVA